MLDIRRAERRGAQCAHHLASVSRTCLLLSLAIGTPLEFTSTRMRGIHSTAVRSVCVYACVAASKNQPLVTTAMRNLLFSSMATHRHTARKHHVDHCKLMSPLFLTVLMLAPSPTTTNTLFIAHPFHTTRLLRDCADAHDDVGWLKTVDQYFYGQRNDFAHAGVK
jgi:hypothetical protein